MQLDINARWRTRTMRLHAPSAVAVARVLLVIALVIQLVRLGWAIVTPAGPLGDWQPQPPLSTGAARDVLAGFDPFFRLERTTAPATATVTSLQLRLYGTRLDDATGGGAAIIAGPDGTQNSYAVGEAVMPGVTLKAVAFDHVTLDRAGTAEDLFLVQPDAADVPATSDTQPAPLVESSDMQPGAGNSVASGTGGVTVAELRAGIGFIPRIDGGRVTGLAVRPQGGSGLFQRLGFSNGDVVTRIAGRPVAGAGDMQAAAAALARGGTLPIAVERGAEVLPLTILVKGQ